VSSRYRLIAEGSSAGLLFLISPLAGYLLGKWLGGLLHAGLWPAYAGAVLGLIAAFWNLLKLVNRVTGR
jgi:putative F0F1-ATPase subunit (Ca2+/Mg2+ transporter)